MKLKLLGKVLTYTLLPIIIGGIVLIFAASHLASSGIYRMADTQLLEFASKQASEIDNILKNLVALGKQSTSAADMKKLSDLANKLGADRDSFSEYTRLRDKNITVLQSIRRDFPDVSGALVIDKNGKCIAHSTPERVGIDLSDYPSVISAFAGKDAVKPKMSKLTGKMSIMIATGIRSEENPNVVDGVLLFVVNLAAVSKKTIEDVSLMPTSHIFLLSDTGTMLMEKAFPELVGKDVKNDDFARAMLAEKNGITRYEWEGVEKVCHFAELPLTKWVVGIETNVSDFYIISNEITIMLIGMGIIILLVVGFVVYSIVRRIVRNISRSADIATYVAEGNLTLTDEQEEQLNRGLRRNDELSTLAQALRLMIKNLERMFDSEEKTRQAELATERAELATKEAEQSALEAEERRQSILSAVVQLEGIVNNISSAADQLTAHIENSTSGASEQSTRMSDTATAMDEMNETVLEVARNSSTSAEIADQTKEKATEGALITEKCQESMTQVKDESLKLRQNMSELAAHAQSINAVMGVISDIADQTNLLALNAAIEAARAGEAGRGFAVVADEVRKLAEKTIASTTDVANAINAIQASTEVNVQQVDTAVVRIEEASELAHDGGEALQVILEMAEHSADGIRAIATASEQQSATSDEIAQSIAAVSNIANSTVTAMNEAAQAVQSLSDQAHQLSDLIEELKKS